MNIQGHAAIVTGGASGLGEATARELARQGAKVAVLDVNAELAQKVAGEINGVACQCDITNTDSVVAALAKASAAHGPARILMNIAGIGSANRVARMHLLHEAPSIDKGEVTDKGSINQRAVLKHRDALIQRFHDGQLPFTIQPGKQPA